MALLTILEYPDERLRIVAKPVTRFDDALARLVEDMFETMYDAKGVGLAATQVNVHQRLLVADVSDERNQRHVLINPEIVWQDGVQVCQEGCLSVPEYRADIERAARIRVRAQDVRGAYFELDADGLLAVCIQHEMDHLNGKLFVDYLSPLKRAIVRQRYEKRARQKQRSRALATA